MHCNVEHGQSITWFLRSHVCSRLVNNVQQASRTRARVNERRGSELTSTISLWRVARTEAARTTAQKIGYTAMDQRSSSGQGPRKDLEGAEHFSTVSPTQKRRRKAHQSVSEPCPIHILPSFALETPQSLVIAQSGNTKTQK